ncbi:TIGR01244 family sulfur transferase [Bartonella sp. CB178]|uniref:TIGR01244 family sulfur transferase n=1 Tax=Bartonella sp. CB178 TaxID=3112255 RepID=UPI00300DCD46
MDLQKIEDDIFISAQISIEDVESLAKAGFRTIVCNRPDGEDPHQPDFSAIKAEAHKHGITAHHVPIVASCYEESDIKSMREILKTAHLPLLAYCHRGGRSIHLYRLARLR